MDEIGAMLVTSTRMRFSRAVGPDGRAWPPSIRAATTGGQTLIDTGRLSDSITHVFDKTSVTIGTNVIYASVHQFGATIRAKRQRFLTFRVGGRWARKRQVTIPPRPFLGPDGEDRAGIIEIVGAHVGEAFR